MTADLKEPLMTAVPWIDEALESGGVVCLHCSRGVSRSCALVIGYLMCKEQSDLQTVIADVKSRRSSCDPTVGFVQQLEDLQRQNFVLADMAGGGHSSGSP